MAKETTNRTATAAAKLTATEINRALDDLRRASALIVGAQDIIERVTPVLRACKGPVASALSQSEK